MVEDAPVEDVLASGVDFRPKPSAARLRHALALGVFVEFPLIFVGWLLWIAVRAPGSFGDFVIFRSAGDDLVHGRSPYVRPVADLLAENDKFVYPAPLAVPFVPFSLVSPAVAKPAYLALSICALLAALRLLGVRDLRCWGISLLTIPVFGALGVGALGPMLLLGLALGWRYRDRAAAGGIFAVVALAKVFLWPMLVWAIATRRFRASAVAAAVVGVICLVWAAIGLSGLRDYPTTLRVLHDVMRWKSYSAESLVLALGLPARVGELAIVLVAVGGVAAIFLLARTRDGDRRAFMAAVGTALLATPILWLHYLILLLVPIALARPRFGSLWLAPLAFWVSPHFESLGSAWRIAVVLAITAGIVVAADRARLHDEPQEDRVPADLVDRLARGIRRGRAGTKAVPEAEAPSVSAPV